ncbi:MAG: hypothetical protein Q9221_000149 [Calogaya cf. arnoldii]
MDDGRVKAFRLLKPPCVELSQTALRYKVRKSTAKDLLKCLERLAETLLTVSRSLDDKLADYVFFPLSHVFSESKELPPRLLEHALSCLRLLIRQGWRDHLENEVGKQLLILLAFLAGGSATDAKSKRVDEDVAAIALDCTASLFHSSVASSLGTRSTVALENIPLLGHTLTVTLDAISSHSANKVRLAACTSLHALIDGIDDQEALRNFFPGIVSCLTKVLSSGIRSKTPWKILQACIQLLDQILCKVLADNTPSSGVAIVGSSAVGENSTKSWVEATASQVKVALSTVLPLRYHDRHDVQEALFKLCLSILIDCRTALGDCVSMTLEALVALSSHAAPEVARRRSQRLQQILASNLDLLDVLKDSLYGWTVALPRVATSNDETKQTRMLEQLSSAFRLLSAYDMDMRAFNNLVVSNLRSSVASAVQLSSTHGINSVASGSAEVSRVLQSATLSGGDRIFSEVIFDSTSQGNIVAGLQMLVKQFQSSAMSMALQRSLTESLKSTTGKEQIAALWLMLELMGSQSSKDSETKQWLNLPSGYLEPLAEEAYAFSLEILDRSAYDDAVDWRLQALSLEVVAFQAKSQGQDFRPELVDALYPILERMGSNNAALQQHAVTCLSIVSDSCGYPSASKLIVQNADYLVNAVAVKLNTFDISPQASQVMLMMVRLCGSAIIPYLDDLIESIFAILACYHGYPRLVESLFEVLNAIVEEGANASPRAIEPATKTIPSRRRPYKPTVITDVVARLQSVKNQSDRIFPRSTPSLEPDPEISSASESEAPQPSTSEETPPQSKAHTLIHNITQQTTHHLSTPSPPLRRLLLTLIASSLQSLSPQSTAQADNDTTFLPLIATLWPHITRQIFSPTSSSTNTTTPSTDLPTLLTALQTLTTLSQYGGSFLLSRFSDLLPQLQSLHHHLEQNMLHEEKTLGRSRTSRSMKFKPWDQMVALIVSMVVYVGITREMEDAVFEMLGGEALLRERQGVRAALEGVNPDAVWLLEEERRSKKEECWDEEWEKRKPVVEGWQFRSVVF